MTLHRKLTVFFILMMMSTGLLTACGKTEDTPENEGVETVEAGEIVFSEEKKAASSTLVNEFVDALVKLDRDYLEENTCTDEDVSGIMAPFSDLDFGPKLRPIMNALEYEFIPEGSDEDHHLYEAYYSGPIAEDLLLAPEEQDEANFQDITFQIGVNIENEACVELFI